MFLPYAIEDEVDYEGFPYVLYFLCGAYLAVHIALYEYMPGSVREGVFYSLGCVPADFRWWAPITCTFLHGGYLHLIGNLYFFWIYGRLCEKALGIWRFLSIYIIGAFVSMIAHCIASPEYMRDIPTIGASGAISAILGAFLVIFPTVKIKVLFFSIITFRPIQMQAPSYFILGAWFIVQLASGLNITGGESTEVAFWAHIAGFACGTVIGTVYLLFHEKIIDEEMKRLKCHLLYAWECLWDGRDDEAKSEFFQSTSDRNSDLPKNSRMINAILSKEIDSDDLGSASHATEYLKERKTRNDYPGVLQAYYWIMKFPELMGKIPAETHLAGCIAAAKLKYFGFAFNCIRKIMKNGTGVHPGMMPLLIKILGNMDRKDEIHKIGKLRE